ncbi:hypothetical protein BGP_4901 [Beggiatoa sp. PS]|nr:hypothetical protein BGP_4901 [Beggiatoa sp. PS]
MFKSKGNSLMTHLAIHNKINLLPLNLLAEVEDYVDFLLQKHQKVQLSNRLEISPDSLTLEPRQQISQTDMKPFVVYINLIIR